MHLANNLYGLLFAGIFLLPITGNVGLILCYVLAGLGGSVASAYVHPSTVSVGASGAVNLALGAASQGIDNAAHVGGLLAGMLLGVGWFLGPQRTFAAAERT